MTLIIQISSSFRLLTEQHYLLLYCADGNLLGLTLRFGDSLLRWICDMWILFHIPDSSIFYFPKFGQLDITEFRPSENYDPDLARCFSYKRQVVHDRGKAKSLFQKSN